MRNKKNKPLIFISHSTEEYSMAKVIKTLVEKIVVYCEVFMSSEDIKGGEDWKKTIFRQLQRADLLITILSPNSILRPWIAFEVGAGWGMKKTTIPILHSGLEIHQLPDPFSIFQSYYCNRSGIQGFIESIKAHFNIKTSKKINIDRWLEECNKNAIKRETILCEIIRGEKHIYEDASAIVSSAQKNIRATGIGNMPPERTNAFNSYQDTFKQHIKNSEINNYPVQVKIARSEKNLPDNIEQKEKDSITKSEHILPNFPRYVNLLIVDTKYMHLSVPMLQVDKGGFRCCIKFTSTRLIEDFVELFDNYLFNQNQD